MEAIIESALITPAITLTRDGMTSDNVKAFEMLQSYNSILTMITISTSKDMLNRLLEHIFAQGQAGKYFIYGFDGDHFWVKQVDYRDERIIFVKLK